MPPSPTAVRLCIAVAALAAASAAPAAAADVHDVYHAALVEPNATTPDISTDAMRQVLADGATIVVDARTPPEFAAGHIPGARNVDASSPRAVADVAALAGDDRARPLVLYCNGPFCQASRRLADALVAAGFTNVRRYQLGMPVWRALGGTVEIELDAIVRVHGRDGTAVFIDARSGAAQAGATLPGARPLPAAEFAAGTLRNPPLPTDDFNTRIVVFGGSGGEAKALADALSRRPWHNVSYFAGPFEALRDAVR